MPIASGSGRALKFEGDSGPYLASISLVQSSPYPAREPGALGALQEGNWVAGRPVASERRLPTAGETARKRPGRAGSR